MNSDLPLYQSKATEAERIASRVLLRSQVEQIFAAGAQIEFIREEPTPESIGTFVGYLSWGGWRTRRHLTQKFGISERQVRLLAERAGPEIVRGPKGFTHIENVPADEASHCAEIAISQGKKMIRWGLGIKKKLHQRIS